MSPIVRITLPDPNVFVAVGLLSAAASTAKSANSSIGVWRRSQLRSAFAPYAGGAVALRFLLAPSALIPASDPTAVAVAPALLHEASTHRDMLFLNMTEGLYRSTSWWRALLPQRAALPPGAVTLGSGWPFPLWSNRWAVRSRQSTRLGRCYGF